ncbi:MAG: uracil phosphoribosyltransferase [Anaerolineae bacterium]|jgi:uracil phosphoribosyltransferase
MNQVFESRHPLVRHKVTVLRQTDTGVRRFREIVWELAALLAYEALADLTLVEKEVTTPLDQATGYSLAERVALVPILRAGLGMVDPIWNLLPEAQVGHIGLYRDEETLQPVEYYSKLPAADQVDVCLLLDPMLATGGSAVAACNILKREGLRRIKYLGLIAAPEGIERLHGAHPDVDIYIAAADCCLNDRGYIVPGLGDAGDRLFGTKIDEAERIPGELDEV